MVSVNRLLDRRSSFPINEWIMDSGAFTRITSRRGHLSAKKYASEIKRWKTNGKLLAAVTQDYMCEEVALLATGLSVADHQRLTIKRYDRLLDLIGGEVYLMPVVQGYEISEYLQHLESWGDRLSLNQWVGVGSICKRNYRPALVEAILIAIKTARPDLKLHGFGLKKTALANPLIWDLLYSADSQAHGLLPIGRRSGKKYYGANDPNKAIEYAQSLFPPTEHSIFYQNHGE
ncbi:hypothetical protein V0288_11190 [Pannus brasiliensis CCIBt3594]|uniref:DeoxyPurine in DNA protein A domain-containing protein n=1 Tax=Pannus brasiliensis CCIBt3594 TaxID=1427578 RepID=A0AAW9QXW5_9CHRO